MKERKHLQYNDTIRQDQDHCEITLSKMRWHQFKVAHFRSLGQNPTEAEVTEIINAVDADKNGVLEFKEFVAMMGNRITNETMERELKEAFR